MPLSFILFRLHPLLLALFILWRFVRPLRLRLAYKIPLGVLLSILCLKQYWYIFTGGTLMNPQLPRSLCMLGTCGMITTLVLFCLVLLRDLVNLPFYTLRKRIRRGLLPSNALWCNLPILLLALAIGVLGTQGGFARPEVVRLEVSLKQLPPAAEGYKIAFLADTHISTPTSPDDLEYIVRTVAEEKPNLILMGGDYQDGSVEQLAAKTAYLLRLTAQDGVYAVSGNHEFYSGYQSWLDYYTQGGLVFLENRGVVLKDKQGQPLFNLCGMMDQAGRNFGLPGAQPEQALAGLNPDLPTIMLSHQPATADLVQNRVDLVLSGHTHGGMAPLLQQLVSKANHGYVSGVYQTENTKVIVSNGTMIWLGFAMRLLVPPQILILTLKTQD
ncbi:MAG: metallophosphoesterase [Succinivibrio sp.]|nr:metallophosphoesterase [Succinivibrio sp.]